MAEAASTAAPDKVTDTEERILTAARTCFSRFGLRKTAMEDIAREADLSRGTLYRYFPDKDALHRAVSESETRRFLDGITSGTARLRSFEAKIEHVALAAMEFLNANPLNAAMASTDPEAFAAAITTRGHDLVVLSVEAIAPIVEEAMHTGELRSGLDPARAAEWIVRMVFSLISTPSATFDRDDPREIRRFLRDFLVPGLG
ncbi:MAG: TetR/AcrR family transcriptional regulator [Acidimicrobiia bacterium]|nr:TetR/AcrR family transcriptional regulator [Acidimicrobiia bacterium]